MYYIQEADKLNFFINKFNIIKLQGNKILLPIKSEEKNKIEIGDKKEIKQTKKEIILAKKIDKIIKKANSNKIVLSKEIKKHGILINKLYSSNFDIIDGKWLLKMMLPEIVEKIIQNQKMKSNETTLYILANDTTDSTIENIKILVEKYKNIYIITKHIEKFKKIEEQILDQTGAIITVMNNKKKSLLKAKIIINIDFPNELINQYNINQESIILDLYGETKIKKKSFTGKIIKDYEIELKNNKEYYSIDEKLYDKKDLYEATFYKQQTFRNVRERIKKDKVVIKKCE